MVSLDATVLVAAFPALRGHFAAATPADLSWVLNGYTIVDAALLVLAGRLADRHGARRIFRLGLALFTLASAGCALAGNVFALSAARVVQAVGAALLAPASLALLLATFPGGRRQGAVDFRVVYALLAGAGLVIAALAPGETPAAATGPAVR
jgi:MFS family permease